MSLPRTLAFPLLTALAALGCGGQAAKNDAGPSEAEAPTLDPTFELRVDDVEGTDLALGPDASLFVVGGKTQLQLDLGASYYRDFWLAQISADGTLGWQVQDVQDADPALSGQESDGRAVAFDGTSITALSVTYSEGTRTHLRRFDADGASLDEELLLPELTVARALPAHAGILLAGSELVSETDGRPFLRARVERSPEATGSWPALFQGVEGGVSQVLSMAVDAAGNASVSGYLGTDPLSNASIPWVARLAPDGTPLFESKLEVSVPQHCSAESVAVSEEGVTLAAGSCDDFWLKAFSPSGSLLWERVFADAVTAVAATANGGYLVATGGYDGPTDVFYPPDDDWHAELLAFDAQHHLLFRVTEPGCHPFHRVLVKDASVFALAQCGSEMLLAKFEMPPDSD